jgi:hypothetical protein
MPVIDWTTGKGYKVTFWVCGACGERAALRAGVWEHKISGRTDCGDQPLGLVPYSPRDFEPGESANRCDDHPAERPHPEDHRVRRDLGYMRRHLNHLFSLTEESERPDIRGAMLDDLREIRAVLSAVGARITSLEG